MINLILKFSIMQCFKRICHRSKYKLNISQLFQRFSSVATCCNQAVQTEACSDQKYARNHQSDEQLNAKGIR